MKNSKKTKGEQEKYDRMHDEDISEEERHKLFKQMGLTKKEHEVWHRKNKIKS